LPLASPCVAQSVPFGYSKSDLQCLIDGAYSGCTLGHTSAISRFVCSFPGSLRPSFRGVGPSATYLLHQDIYAKSGHEERQIFRWPFCEQTCPITNTANTNRSGSDSFSCSFQRSHRIISFGGQPVTTAAFAPPDWLRRLARPRRPLHQGALQHIFAPQTSSSGFSKAPTTTAITTAKTLTRVLIVAFLGCLLYLELETNSKHLRPPIGSRGSLCISGLALFFNGTEKAALRS
jgi:hypothetical protein